MDESRYAKAMAAYTPSQGWLDAKAFVEAGRPKAATKERQPARVAAGPWPLVGPRKRGPASAPATWGDTVSGQELAAWNVARKDHTTQPSGVLRHFAKSGKRGKWLEERKMQAARKKQAAGNRSTMVILPSASRRDASPPWPSSAAPLAQAAGPSATAPVQTPCRRPRCRIYATAVQTSDAGIAGDESGRFKGRAPVTVVIAAHNQIRAQRLARIDQHRRKAVPLFVARTLTPQVNTGSNSIGKRPRQEPDTMGLSG